MPVDPLTLSPVTHIIRGFLSVPVCLLIELSCLFWILKWGVSTNRVLCLCFDFFLFELYAGLFFSLYLFYVASARFELMVVWGGGLVVFLA